MDKLSGVLGTYLTTNTAAQQFVHGVVGHISGQPGSYYGSPYPSYEPPGTTHKLPGSYTTLANLHGQVAWGPWLRYMRFDPATQRYDLSVLVVAAPEALPPLPTMPQLLLTDTPAPAHLPYGAPPTPVGIVPPPPPPVAAQPASPVSWPCEVLATWDRFTFFRFKFSISLAAYERQVTYQVILGPGAHPNYCAATRPYTFTAPAAGAEWHWGFYSCNGFHEYAKEVEYGGVTALWRHVLLTHARRPLHVMVGGGDQIYNDDVWQGPVLSRWMVKDDRQAHADPAVSAPFDPAMRREAEEYYFSHYVTHFSQDVLAQALATIPYIMSWDDHDIFDGWGSYKPAIQAAPVMQGVYQASRFFYLLFQMHTTEARMAADGYWGSQGCGHSLAALGPGVSLLALDTRSARTQHQVVPPADMAVARTALLALPPSVAHVVLLAPVPVLYPEVPIQKTLDDLNEGRAHFSLQALATLMGKTGLGHTITNSRFGMVDLLDDIIDHWDATQHRAERDALLTMLLEVSAARCKRVSIISGDVHVAGYGQFYSRPRGANPDLPEVPYERDPRFMAQVISSAIGNEPPPAAVIQALQIAGARSKPVLADVQERMVGMFPDPAGGGAAMQLLAGRRNWCEVCFDPPPGGTVPDGSLTYVLHLERSKGSGGHAVDSLPIHVPRLLPPA